ncbi:cathepsin L [Caerostris extrusa]|uniref:Cathepsin L n=1 Tax=Caerostris extrusa TaxID=172846 RepID=A0AAV4XV62_CAEEX|nr:cathepsin L [Caerostris extrusa]
MKFLLEESLPDTPALRPEFYPQFGISVFQYSLSTFQQRTMKFLALFALFAVAAASRHMLFDQQLNEHWENFKKTFGKQYSGGEEVVRRTIWERRVADIVRHNLQEHEEFVKTFNGYRGLVSMKSNASSWVLPSNVRIPDKVDWRDQGLVTPVKNQQQCEFLLGLLHHWLSLEGQHMKKTGKLVSLSEQNLVDCSGPEESYPYTAEDGTCHFKKADVGATVTGYVDIPTGDEDALKKAVATVGPISVAIDASHDSFQTYQDGVYDEPECSPDQLDHGVLIVGYGTEDGSDYWLVKNSWGKTWESRDTSRWPETRTTSAALLLKPAILWFRRVILSH